MKRILIYGVVSFLFFNCSMHGQKALFIGDFGDYIEVPEFSIDDDAFTIEFWIKLQEKGSGNFYSLFEKQGNPPIFSAWMTGDFLPLELIVDIPPNNLSVPNVLSNEVWNHIAVTQDTNTFKLYLNGDFVAATNNPLPMDSESSLFIGAGNSEKDTAIAGPQIWIDELRIWKTSRSAAEINSTKHEVLPDSLSNLLSLYFPFDSLINGRPVDKSINGLYSEIVGQARLVDSDAPIGFTPLPALSCFRAYGEYGYIQLNWCPLAGDLWGYELYRDEQAEFTPEEANLIGVIPSSDSTFRDTTAQSGVFYFYKIRAIDQDKRAGNLSAAVVGRVLSTDEEIKCGIYYYAWFEKEIWPDDFLRWHTLPPQLPLLGLYGSDEDRTIQNHLYWMDAFGIDFIINSWWGIDSPGNMVAKTKLFPAVEGKDMKVTFFYESPDLQAYSTTQGPFLWIDEGSKTKLINDIKYIATNFFDHPNWLKINGRPVLFIYLTGAFKGDYLAAFAELRN